MNQCIFAFVNREPTALLMEVRDEGTDYLEATKPDHVTIIDDISEADPNKYSLLIMVTPFGRHAPDGMLELHFVPMVGTIGFGLAHHPEDYEAIYDEIDEAFANRGILPCSHKYCTIDVKEDEEFCAMLEDEYNEEVMFFTAEELSQVEVPNPSATVEKYVGTSSVCEAAAILGSNHGKLIIPKVKGKNWTAALAIDYKYLREQKGHIEIVGAGPGDPDLVSVRGRKMLEKADLILYAGSLVPKALTECHKPGAVVRSSADMALEEQCELMKKFYDQGKYIVRLHTGDPCIFGATVWTIISPQASVLSSQQPQNCRVSLRFLSVVRPSSSLVARGGRRCLRKSNCIYWPRVRVRCASSCLHPLSTMCSANSCRNIQRIRLLLPVII